MSMLGGSPHTFILASTSITVGDHVTKKVGPFTLNMDTVWATGAAVIVCCVIAFLLHRQATSGPPGRLQAAWEMGIGALTKQVDGTIGPKGASVIPLAATLFLFIFVCNTFTALGLGAHFDWLAPPNADINLPLAMAIFVIVLVHIASVRVRGVRGYLKHYLTQPFPIFLLPFNLFINLVEEIAKPITLALRLFGNLFSGALMLSLIAALGVWKLGGIPIGDFFTFFMSIIWKLFDVFLIGPIQAFIFALLTILYFDTAMSDVH